MAFRLPTFNLIVNLWRAGNAVAAAPDVVSAGALAQGEKEAGLLPTIPGVTLLQTQTWMQRMGRAMTVLLPKGTDVRGFGTGAVPAGDCAEVPAGSGRYYAVVWVDDVGRGFANEYRTGLLVQLTAQWLVATGNPWGAAAWPVPTP